MQLTDLENPSGFLPEAALVLPRLAAPSHHVALGRRPPAGLYAVSLTKVNTRFRLLLDEHSRLVGTAGTDGRLSKPNLVDITERLDSFLDAMFEHLEDCLNVLGCFVPPAADVKKSKPVRAYKNSILPYRNYLGNRVNHLKHTQGRLRWVLVLAEGRTHFGYFFEGIRADGVVGPHPVIPSKLDADSIAYTLRFHLYYLFEVGRHLSAAARQLATLGPEVRSTGTQISQDLLSIVRDVAGLPLMFFPGESKHPWPDVQFDQTGVAATATLSFLPEAPAGVREIPPGSEVNAWLEGDGTPNQKHLLPLYRAPKR